KKEIKAKTVHFNNLFLIFSSSHSCLANFFCFGRSRSIMYSIFLNTCSIKMVCGQIHPQYIRPYTTVNSTIKTIEVIIPKGNKKKSDVKNGNPNIINSPLEILKRKMGFPLGNFIKGDKMKTASKTQLTYVLYLVNFPEGFLGNTHLRLPSLCTVPKLV